MKGWELKERDTYIYLIHKLSITLFLLSEQIQARTPHMWPSCMHVRGIKRQLSLKSLINMGAVFVLYLQQSPSFVDDKKSSASLANTKVTCHTWLAFYLYDQYWTCTDAHDIAFHLP